MTDLSKKHFLMNPRPLTTILSSKNLNLHCYNNPTVKSKYWVRRRQSPLSSLLKISVSKQQKWMIKRSQKASAAYQMKRSTMIQDSQYPHLVMSAVHLNWSNYKQNKVSCPQLLQSSWTVSAIFNKALIDQQENYLISYFLTIIYYISSFPS